MTATVKLERLTGEYTVVQLGSVEPIPDWAEGSGFVSISRSDQELSVLCQSDRVPGEVRQDSGWTCLRLNGPIPLDLAGVLLSVIRPLSEAGIGIFVVSTFDGDHILVKGDDFARSRELLRDAGHEVN